LNFPLENSRAGGSGFGFGDVAGCLQRDGERGVREGIAGRERGEGERSADGGLELSGIAEGADQAMMRIVEVLVGGNGSAEGAGGIGGPACGEQV